MGVADQHMAVQRQRLGFHQHLTQFVRSGSAVNDDQSAEVRTDLDARGISTVPDRVRPRLGNGTTRTPEADSHDRSLEGVTSEDGARTAGETSLRKMPVGRTHGLLLRKTQTKCSLRPCVEGLATAS